MRNLFVGILTVALGFICQSANAQTYAVGTTALTEGPAAGTDSVTLGVFTVGAGWTNTANVSWLHLDASNQRGTNSANVIFTFDANTNVTRSGTLTIATHTVTVTQAGTNYAPAGVLTTVVPQIGSAATLAVASNGIVYFYDGNVSAVKTFTPTNNVVTTVISNLPFVIALNAMTVDNSGNVYMGDIASKTIQKWTASNNSIAPVVTNLNIPHGVAVDGAGNIYIAELLGNKVSMWSAATSNLTTLFTINRPWGMAIDVAGNLYVASNSGDTVVKWTAASNTVTTLIPSVNGPEGVAVDVSGNVYVNDYDNASVLRWNAIDGTFTTTGSAFPRGVGVDRLGCLYITDSGRGAILALPRAFVSTTDQYVPATTSNGVLPTVLPAGVDVGGPFAPTNQQPWLTFTGSANGVIGFSFGTNAGTARSSQFQLLGRTNVIVQAAATNTLGLTNRVEGPAAGSDSVTLAAMLPTTAWTATTATPWLHIGAGFQNGTGSTNVVFTFDANTGATRTGTLTIASITVTVTQAGVNYVPAATWTPIVAATNIAGPAIDRTGNVYFVENNTATLKKWSSTDNSVSTLLPSLGFSATRLAVDGGGNVYFADVNHLIWRWRPGDSSASIFVSVGADNALRLRADGAGNLYMMFGLASIGKCTVGYNAIEFIDLHTTGGYHDITIDAAGNLYVARSGPTVIWTAVNNLVSSNNAIFNADMIALDGAGDIYSSYSVPSAAAKWHVADNSVSPMTLSGLLSPDRIDSDAAGSLFMSDITANAIKALPRVFVDVTAKLLSAGAGTGVLSPVAPTNANLKTVFAPTSDQSWLTITGVTNGVVSFAVASNPGAPRQANITLLGNAIPVTQLAAPAIGGAGKVGLSFQLAFTNAPSASFHVFASTNVDTPLNLWSNLGVAIESPAGSGSYQFTDTKATNSPRKFYLLQSP